MRLRGLTVVCALAALVSCSKATPSAVNSSAAPSGATATPAASSTGPTPTFSAHTSSSPTTHGTPAPLPPPPGRAPQSAPPAAGAYTYSQSGSTTYGTATVPADPQGTLTIDRATLLSGGQRQHSTHKYSDSRTAEQDLIFETHAIYLAKAVEHIIAGPFSQDVTCEPKQPLLAIKLPLATGAQWNSNGECDGEAISISASVVRAENRSVGGKSIATFVVRSTIQLTGSQYTATSHTDAWLSTAYRLIVHTVEKTDGDFNGTPFSRDLTEDLQNVTPR